MSEEEKHFNRSQTGHDANDLHKHGGLEAHEEEKTNREELEEAIEALEEGEDEDEVVDVESIEGVEHGAPEEVASEDEIKENEAIEKIEAEAKPEEIKPTRPSMTIDEVEEKKAKCGAGWKVCTVLFLLLAIAGCGAAAYLFFNNGKVEMLGRTVESHKTTEKPVSTPAAETTTVTPVDEKPAIAKGDIIVPEMGIKLKYDYEKYIVAYRYSQNGTLKLWVSPADMQYTPDFANPDVNQSGMGGIRWVVPGGEVNIDEETTLLELDDNGGKIVEFHPQVNFTDINNAEEVQFEQEMRSVVGSIIQTIEKL